MATVSQCLELVPEQVWSSNLGVYTYVYLSKPANTDTDSTPDSDVSYCLDSPLIRSNGRNIIILTDTSYPNFKAAIQEPSSGGGTPGEGPVEIQSQQVDLIASTILVCAMSLAFCIGWLCHEMGAK